MFRVTTQLFIIAGRYYRRQHKMKFKSSKFRKGRPLCQTHFYRRPGYETTAKKKNARVLFQRFHVILKSNIMSQLLVAKSICDGVPLESWAKALPKNFFILPNNLWSDLRQLSFQGNDVVAFEVTTSAEENCKRMFLNLSREHEGLMFCRVVFDRLETIPMEVRQ